jgi:hypothetical protein
MMSHAEPSMVESALARCAISILPRLWLRLLTPPVLIALGFDRSKALLDSAGHPGLPISQSMSGATAEKASPLESVSLPLKNGGIEVDQIVYAPPDDPFLVLRCRLSPLGIVQQQPGGDFPFLLNRRP